MDKKYAYSFCKFMHAELRRIDIEKWIEGTRRNSDPGEGFVVEWINKNAIEWRKLWDDSSCKSCDKWKECAHLVKPNCSDYVLDVYELSATD